MLRTNARMASAGGIPFTSASIPLLSPLQPPLSSSLPCGWNNPASHILARPGAFIHDLYPLPSKVAREQESPTTNAFSPEYISITNTNETSSAASLRPGNSGNNWEPESGQKREGQREVSPAKGSQQITDKEDEIEKPIIASCGGRKQPFLDAIGHFSSSSASSSSSSSLEKRFSRPQSLPLSPIGQDPLSSAPTAASIASRIATLFSMASAQRASSKAELLAQLRMMDPPKVSTGAPANPPPVTSSSLTNPYHLLPFMQSEAQAPPSAEALNPTHCHSNSEPLLSLSPAAPVRRQDGSSGDNPAEKGYLQSSSPPPLHLPTHLSPPHLSLHPARQLSMASGSGSFDSLLNNLSRTLSPPELVFSDINRGGAGGSGESASDCCGTTALSCPDSILANIAPPSQAAAQPWMQLHSPAKVLRTEIADVATLDEVDRTRMTPKNRGQVAIAGGAGAGGCTLHSAEMTVDCCPCPSPLGERAAGESLGAFGLAPLLPLDRISSMSLAEILAEMGDAKTPVCGAGGGAIPAVGFTGQEERGGEEEGKSTTFIKPLVKGEALVQLEGEADGGGSWSKEAVKADGPLCTVTAAAKFLNDRHPTEAPHQRQPELTAPIKSSLCSNTFPSEHQSISMAASSSMAPTSPPLDPSATFGKFSRGIVMPGVMEKAAEAASAILVSSDLLCQPYDSQPEAQIHAGRNVDGLSNSAANPLHSETVGGGPAKQEKKRQRQPPSWYNEGSPGLRLGMPGMAGQGSGSAWVQQSSPMHGVMGVSTSTAWGGGGAGGQQEDWRSALTDKNVDKQKRQWVQSSHEDPEQLDTRGLAAATSGGGMKRRRDLMTGGTQSPGLSLRPWAGSKVTAAGLPAIHPAMNPALSSPSFSSLPASTSTAVLSNVGESMVIPASSRLRDIVRMEEGEVKCRELEAMLRLVKAQQNQRQSEALAIGSDSDTKDSRAEAPLTFPRPFPAAMSEDGAEPLSRKGSDEFLQTHLPLSMVSQSEESAFTSLGLRRGPCTEPQALAARARRERINARMRLLQSLVPGATSMTTENFLLEAVQYIKFLENQVVELTEPEDARETERQYTSPDEEGDAAGYRRNIKKRSYVRRCRRFMESELDRRKLCLVPISKIFSVVGEGGLMDDILLRQESEKSAAAENRIDEDLTHTSVHGSDGR